MPRKKVSDFEDLKRRDTDHDGLSDYEEIFVYHSDPLEPESAHDGLGDLQKAKLAMDFNKPPMKDFFIPNKNNNYKPHALKTKRIFFYSLSAIFVKVIVVAFVFVFPVTAWLTPDLLKTESTKIVTLTNDLRQSLGLSDLKSNELLDSAALAKAEDMVLKQYFAHLSPENRGLRYWLSSKGYNYDVAGENLAIGFSAPEEVVQAWKNSPTHYANLIDPDYNEIGVAMVAGNYQGYDTTLVAQMFGTQKSAPIEPKEEVIIVPSPETVDNTTNEKSVLAVKSVEVSKKIEPLAVPVIVNDVDGLLTKESKLNLQILAPEAKELNILVNDQQQSNIKLEKENIETEINLSFGKNKIIIQAIDGSRESRSTVYTVEYDNQVPIMDEGQSFISVVKGTNDKEFIIKVEVLMSSDDTKDASVAFHDFNIALRADSQNNNLWLGHRVIENINDKFFSPTVPATLLVNDQAGNVLIQDLAWRDLILDRASKVNQYLFIKNTDSDYLKPIFNISSWYYKAMILLAVLALIFNVFIEIKKQHPKTIASTLCFVALLSILLMF